LEHFFFFLVQTNYLVHIRVMKFISISTDLFQLLRTSILPKVFNFNHSNNMHPLKAQLVARKLNIRYLISIAFNFNFQALDGTLLTSQYRRYCTRCIQKWWCSWLRFCSLLDGTSNPVHQFHLASSGLCFLLLGYSVRLRNHTRGLYTKYW